MKLDKTKFCRGFAEEYGYRKSDIYIIYDDLIEYMHKQLSIGNTIHFKSVCTLYPSVQAPRSIIVPNIGVCDVGYNLRLKCKFSDVLTRKLKQCEEIDGKTLKEFYLETSDKEDKE